MNATEQLRIQYDSMSKTVLVQCKDRSHVLREHFSDKESAERAAEKFAIENWGYKAAQPTTRH